MSDPRQKTEGNGLESQETRMRKYAAAKGYQIVRVFSEDISGKNTERSELKAMLAFLKKQKEQFGVLIDHASRLTRNQRDHWPLRDAITAVGAILESQQQRYAQAPEPEEELYENIDASVNHYHRRANAKQTVNRMRARAMKGYYCFPAPTGYKFVEIKPHGKIMVRHEPVASVIRDVFEGYASGYFQSLAEARRFLEECADFPEKRRKRLTNSG